MLGSPASIVWRQRTEGMAIRRTGFEGWLRNIAVALGNAETTPEVVACLNERREDDSKLVAEHVAWALARHGERNDNSKQQGEA